MTSDCSSDYTNSSVIKEKNECSENFSKIRGAGLNFGLVYENIFAGKVHKLFAKIEHRIL